MDFGAKLELLQRIPYFRLLPAPELRALATGEIDFETPATPARVRELVAPTAVTVGVSASCPFCPAETSASLRLALASPLLSVTVNVATYEPDLV